MRNMRSILTALLFLLLLTNVGIGAFATNRGFSTELLPEEQIKSILKYTGISMLTEEPPKRAIRCFDVNEDGIVAIGCSDGEKRTVCLYTSDGDFQYGYSFITSGDFAIELEKDILTIYSVRGSFALSVNPMGEVLRIVEIQDTIENHSHWRHSVYLTKREIGGMNYILKNDMGVFNIFASSYSQLITVNEDGEEKIIYDVNTAQFVKTIMVCVGIIAVISLAVAVLGREFIRLNHGT